VAALPGIVLLLLQHVLTLRKHLLVAMPVCLRPMPGTLLLVVHVCRQQVLVVQLCLRPAADASWRVSIVSRQLGCTACWRRVHCPRADA
jgi:hypothetical protein